MVRGGGGRLDPPPLQSVIFEHVPQLGSSATDSRNSGGGGGLFWCNTVPCQLFHGGVVG